MPLPDIVRTGLTAIADDLADRYRDLHAHPELSMQETRTAGIVADQLRVQGWEVTERVGVTGVVGVLRNGDGPTVLLRADMDGLPVKEETGLPYASTATGLDADGHEQPVMHACGHDAHMTALLGATTLLARHHELWHGTVLAVFQPGEEIGAGARAMLDDGFLDRFGVPDVCLGQHVMPLPAGHVALRGGTMMATSTSLQVRLIGRGGHGSMPHTTVDPIVMAAVTVMRLQTVVARTVSPADTAVVTIGSLHAGSKENIIPEDATLKLNIRSLDPEVGDTVRATVERIIHAEADASNAPQPPEITPLNDFPLTVNDSGATERVRAALAGELGLDCVHEIGPVAASEDFGAFGAAAGVPSVFWFWGGNAAPDAERGAAVSASGRLLDDVPSNHSSRFAPVVGPTLEAGVRCLLAAAFSWLT